MKILSNTPDRLVLSQKPGFTLPIAFCAIFFALIVLFVLYPEVADGEFVAYGLGSTAFITVMTLVMARRAAHSEIIFDRTEDTLTINWHRRQGTETQTVPLSTVTRAHRSSLDRSYRIEIRVEDGRTLPLTPLDRDGNQLRAINRINDWLTADR
ncbi:hypothetical protein [Gymnodinialimonas sp.]